MDDDRDARRAPPATSDPPASNPGACIDTDELVAMSEGALPADRVDAVLAHVDACPACAEVVASLGAFEEGARRVGRYQLERVLGTGAMGIVYAAWDPELRRRVAVKLVRPERTDGAARSRMLREARALARIGHPNVVAVHDVGEHDGDIYVATELVDGETLSTWGAGRDARHVALAWIQVARGLAAAHAEGVVHRDVKPANALVGRDGRVRIGDFGLARHSAEGPEDRPFPSALDAAIGSQATETGAVSGTPAYMAPEQRAGLVDARSDQFSLCVALVEALTGRRPGPDAEVQLPGAGLACALSRGLRRDPDERFPSMGALADALASALAPPASRARRAVIAAAVLGAVAIGSPVAWLGSRSRGAECEVAVVPDEVWSPARRDWLESALPGRLAPRIDASLAAWSAAARDVCAGDRDAPALRERRQRCLAGLLEQLDRQLDAWQASAPPDAMAMHAVLDELPRPAICSRAAVLATAEPTAEQAARIEPIRAQLDAARQSGPIDEVLRLVDAARAIGHAPFTLEAMVGLAGRQAQSDVPAAVRTLRGAMVLADRVGHDDWWIAATVDLVGLLGAEDVSEAAALAEQARERIARLGGDPAREANLDYNLGNVSRSARRHDDAIAAFERARRAFRVAFGPDPPHEAIVLGGLAGVYFDRDPDGSRGRTALAAAAALFRRNGIDMPVTAPADPAALIEQTRELLAIATRGGRESAAVVDATYNLAIAYTLADQPERAVEHYTEAIAMSERLGRRDQRLADGHSQKASLLIDLGRAREAVTVARRAVALAEELALDPELGAALTALGDALLETGQSAAAREPLRRALAIRDRLHESGRRRGNTRFLLATALWKVDRERARGLAQAARVDVRGFIDGLSPDDPNTPYLRRQEQARLDRIDRWLRKHR
jgi:eukaryotic-like serine/threonine-protein kinase